MLFVGHVQEVPIPPSRLELNDELIEHHFAQRIWRTVPPSDQPHRHVAVARERSLHDREIQPQGTDVKFAKAVCHTVDSVPHRRNASISATAKSISRNTPRSVSITRRERSDS